MELDTSRHALLPQDKGLLARITNATTGFAEYGANRGTVKGETSAWDKYWVPYCQAMGTPVWRTSEAALYPQREGLLHIGFVIDTWQKMKPRRKADPAPKIQSAVNVLTHIRRRHGRKGYEMPAPTMLKFVAQGMATRRCSSPTASTPLCRNAASHLRPSRTIACGYPSGHHG